MQIKAYNDFLSNISQSDFGKGNYFLQEIMKDYNEVTVDEACKKTKKMTRYSICTSFIITACVISVCSRYDDIQEIFQYIEKCCCLSCHCYTNSFEKDSSLLKCVVPQVYHLQQLQEDLTSEILSQLRFIKPAVSIAMAFSCKNIQESVATTL